MVEESDPLLMYGLYLVPDLSGCIYSKGSRFSSVLVSTYLYVCTEVDTWVPRYLGKAALLLGCQGVKVGFIATACYF